VRAIRDDDEVPMFGGDLKILNSNQMAFANVTLGKTREDQRRAVAGSRQFQGGDRCVNAQALRRNREAASAKQGVPGIVGAGEAFSFGPDHIHRLTGEEERSVSIHAYSPPLWRLGQYAIDDTGVMRRQSISYADELRPVEVAA